MKRIVAYLVRNAILKKDHLLLIKNMVYLIKGTEANSLRVLVETVDIKPYSKMRCGIIEDGMVLKFGRYNLENVLVQMLEDYGEDELIKRIKSLE